MAATSPARRVVVTEFITLDGVIESPSWSMPYWNDAIAAFKGEETAAAGSLLLGRTTFEMFAAAWPTSPDEGAPVMNAFVKHVATSTQTQEDLDRLAWNGRRLDGPVPDAVRALAAALVTADLPAGDLLVYGSATLARTLLAHGLVDELRLLVYPVVVGAGLRLFGEGVAATLDLVEARPMGGGVVALVYRPAAQA